MHDDPADPRAPQLEQDAGRGGGELSVHQQRQGGEELADAPDPVGPRDGASEQRIDDRHLHRPGADGLDRFRPRVHRLPDEPVGIQ